MDDKDTQHVAIDTSQGTPRHGEGYPEVTTDGSSFKGAHVNGMETPYALTEKIITAMGLGIHDFPNLITIRNWTRRSGVTKASTQQALNPGLQQISPITPTSHSLPSPLEPHQFQDLHGKQTIAACEASRLEPPEELPDLLQSIDDPFDLHAILGVNSHSSVDFSKSGLIATGSTSSLQEVQRLQEKNK